MPKLLKTYLAIGARIGGPPAWDRDFGTIDFLTLLDLKIDLAFRAQSLPGPAHIMIFRSVRRAVALAWLWLSASFASGFCACAAP